MERIAWAVIDSQCRWRIMGCCRRPVEMERREQLAVEMERREHLAVEIKRSGNDGENGLRVW